MNLPNKLTILRIFLTPLFMLMLVLNFPFHHLAAAVVFVVAAITDFFDGKIARKRGLVTDFGKFLDPLADKMLTTSAFLGFIFLDIGYGSVWIAFIVLFREFMISSIRLIASTSGGKVIAANIWGKLKTVSQIIAITFALVGWQVKEIFSSLAMSGETVTLISDIISISASVLLWISAVICVISGAIYLIDNKDFIKQTK